MTMQALEAVVADGRESAARHGAALAALRGMVDDWPGYLGVRWRLTPAVAERLISHARAAGALVVGDPPIPSPPATVYLDAPGRPYSGLSPAGYTGPSVIVFPAALTPGLGAGYDDATAINWALQQVGPYGVVRLVPGLNYTAYSPITCPPGPAAPTLDGGVWHQATANDFAGLPPAGGTVITASPAFSGTAVIEQVNTAGTWVGGMHLRNFTIEGNQLASGSGVQGIHLEGGLATGSIHGVMVHRTDGDLLVMAQNTASGLNPDDWHIAASKFSSSRSGRGVFLSSAADSWFSDCEASENALHGWNWNVSGNIRFLSCKGENNGGAGFAYDGGGGYPMLTGCTTQYNMQDGFYFTGAGSSAQSGVILTGCRSWSDGQAGGTTYAGFRASGAGYRIMGAGCQTITNTIGPAYGASEVAASYGMAFTGSWLTGLTAATYDDASNTHALVNQSPVPF